MYVVVSYRLNKGIDKPFMELVVLLILCRLLD